MSWGPYIIIEGVRFIRFQYGQLIPTDPDHRDDDPDPRCLDRVYHKVTLNWAIRRTDLHTSLRPTGPLHPYLR